MIPIPERIHQIVSGTNGVKASKLCATLAVEYLASTKPEVRAIIITMVKMNELVEVEYRLPNLQNESLLLPAGSRIMGWSHQ